MTKSKIQRNQVVGKALRKAYEVLCRACKEHEEHTALFRIEAPEDVHEDKCCIEVKFDMAIAHHTLSNAACRSKPIWIMMETRINEGFAKIQSSKTTDLDDERCSMAGQASQSIASDSYGRSNGRSVHFETPRSEISPRLIPATGPTSEIVVDRRKRDLCDHIRRWLYSPVGSNDLLVLEETQEYRHVVMPSTFTACSDKWEGVTLAQLIQADSLMPGLISVIPLYERVKLAKMLAIIVLQFHNTPWIRVTWSCSDVLFFNMPKEYSVMSKPDVSTPHLSATVSERYLQQTTSTPTMARNPLLFSLCAVLLELAFASTLDQLQEPCDADGSKNHGNFFTASRLAKEMRSPMGVRYNSVVEQLFVQCISSTVEDLQDPQVQGKLHEQIVCPLEELEHGLRTLMIA